MVIGSTNYTKLKTNLKLSIERLKLLEKKKIELGQKARREIGEFIVNGKYERARIRVENIIRDDYLVEAMEIIEMYCDLIIARFGLIEQVKTLDEGLAEAISSVIWASNRVENCQELKVIADLFAQKYGKQYAIAARNNTTKTVNERLMQKLSIEVPPKLLVEKYLIEIAKSQNIPFEPDLDVMKEDEIYLAEEAVAENEKKNLLIDFSNESSFSSHTFPPMAPNQSSLNNNLESLQLTFPVKPPELPKSFLQSFDPLPSINLNQNSDLKSDLESNKNPEDQKYKSKFEKEKKKKIKTNFKFDETDNSNLHEYNESLPSYSSLFPNHFQPNVENKLKPNLPSQPTPSQPKVNMPANEDDILVDFPAVPLKKPNLDDFKSSIDDNDNIDINDLAKRFEALKKRK